MSANYPDTKPSMVLTTCVQVSTIASKGAIDHDALGHSNLIAKLLDKLSIVTN
jgi:hypothetical protein